MPYMRTDDAVNSKKKIETWLCMKDYFKRAKRVFGTNTSAYQKYNKQKPNNKHILFLKKRRVV